MTTLRNAPFGRRPSTAGSGVKLATNGLLVMFAGCSVPQPSTTDTSAGKVPGQPFVQNLCFRCTLRSCSGQVHACAQEASCSQWLGCVSDCPTDDSGVAAEGGCLRGCGLPVSAEVLFGCIQDFATGVLIGCEQACTPP